jgi:predicted nucleic acid-binding protein
MASTVEFLCDTSVLIDYLRGDEKVREILQADHFGRMSMSSVTLMELVVGAFNKQEVRMIRNAFHDMAIVQINEEISEKAVDLIASYSKSHNLLIPDALIAASALVRDLPLFTRNISDFRFIPGLQLVNES